MRPITYEKAVQLTERNFVLIPLQAILNLTQVEYYEEYGREEIMFGYVYYTRDSLIQEWIEENIDLLVNELNMVIIKLETLDCVIGIPTAGHDLIEEYFVDFWNLYYGNSLEEWEKMELEKGLRKILEEDKEYEEKYGYKFEDMKFLVEDGTLEGEVAPIQSIDFDAKEIYISKGLNYVATLLEHDIENYRIERGICLDNDWYILERSE